MASLPAKPDLEQLRTQAKELKRAFNEGDKEAFDRVLRSHPKFAGRPKKRLQDRTIITLRDAQATLAGEHGFESWKALLAEIEGDSATRWSGHGSRTFTYRAFKEATGMRHRLCTSQHFVLALLNPKEPTPAADVLTELGLTYNKAVDHSRMWQGRKRASSNTSSTPSFQLLAGWAEGYAVAMGVDHVTDEHVLLALAYMFGGGESDLVWYDIDPDDVVNGLRARGVPVPRFSPPVARTPSGPRGPYVYFRNEDWSAVTQELIKRHPPGVAIWGTNRSISKEGYSFVHGEDSIPIVRIVRSSVRDRNTVEVVSSEDGRELERRGPRRSKQPPANQLGR